MNLLVSYIILLSLSSNEHEKGKNLRNDTNNGNNKSELTIRIIFRGLEKLQNDRDPAAFLQNVNLNEMVMCLEDLINYFAQPEDDMGMNLPTTHKKIVAPVKIF